MDRNWIVIIDCHATCSLKQNSSLCDRARCGYGCTFGLCFFGKVVFSRVTCSFKGIPTMAWTCLWNWLVMMSITMSTSLCIETVLHVVSSLKQLKQWLLQNASSIFRFSELCTGCLIMLPITIDTSNSKTFTSIDKSVFAIGWIGFESFATGLCFRRWTLCAMTSPLASLASIFPSMVSSNSLILHTLEWDFHGISIGISFGSLDIW